MDTHEALLTRRTIHEFAEGPVDEATILRGLEAALRAPNHKLTNPWRFTRVGPDTRQKIIDLGVALKTASKNLSEERQQKVRRKWSAPYALFVVSTVLANDPLRRREDYAACACAIENFSLSLWADGVGSKWSTSQVIRDPQTYELLQFDPDDEEIIALFWVGRPGTIPDPPRRPLEEVLREVQ